MRQGSVGGGLSIHATSEAAEGIVPYEVYNGERDWLGVRAE